MVLNTTERALWLGWAQSRKLDSVWIAPHASNVDLIEIPGVEGSHADDVAFCDFIGEADKIGVDVQLFASPMSLTGKGADEVDLRFAINCTKSMLAAATGAGRAPTRSANPPLTKNSKPLFQARLGATRDRVGRDHHVPANDAAARPARDRDASREVATAQRTSRWWFHTLNASYTALGTAIVRSHPTACTGVYLYLDTYSTHGCAAAAAHAPCGRFAIGAQGQFSSATDSQIAERVRPYQALGVTVTVSMDLTTSSVLDGSAHKGVAAAVATAVRHNLTGLMLDYEPRTNYTAAHERAYASLIKALATELHQHGLELDICISDWSILTSFGLCKYTSAPSAASRWRGLL